jgi:hypothetical protein
LGCLLGAEATLASKGGMTASVAPQERSTGMFFACG